MLWTARSIGAGVLTLIAALVIGLGSSVSTAAPASASTTPGSTDAQPPSPMPLFGFVNPVAIGLHVIDALAGGIADLVEFVSTPEPIVIRAPQTT